VLATRRDTALVRDTGERLPVSAPDEVLVSGMMANGAPMSLHYRGGAARDENGLFWEIHGTEGDIRLTGPSGHAQMVQLSLSGARDNDDSFRRLQAANDGQAGLPEDVEPRNVARVYAAMARDLSHGSHTAPTFEDAVEVHRVISAIETAAETGIRTRI